MSLNPALAIKELRRKIGNLDNLLTSNKSSLVGAINEVAQGGGGHITSVQSDWNVNDSESPAYIKNKPIIPAGQIQSDWNQTNVNAKDYIKNKPSPYELPIATPSVLGGIMPDDDTIKVSNSGVARAVFPYIPELYVSGTTLYISTEEQLL